jgi:hypothetical protein
LLITPSLGVPNWSVIYINTAPSYLRNTKDMVLVYGGCEEVLGVKGYVDASFDTDPDDSKSQTGYVFMLNGGVMT